MIIRASSRTRETEWMNEQNMFRILRTRHPKNAASHAIAAYRKHHEREPAGSDLVEPDQVIAASADELEGIVYD
jgi:hypothetical protein